MYLLLSFYSAMSCALKKFTFGTAICVFKGWQNSNFEAENQNLPHCSKYRLEQLGKCSLVAGPPPAGTSLNSGDRMDSWIWAPVPGKSLYHSFLHLQGRKIDGDSLPLQIINDDSSPFNPYVTCQNLPS